MEGEFHEGKTMSHVHAKYVVFLAAEKTSAVRNVKRDYVFGI